jgi:hypothetical protein
VVARPPARELAEREGLAGVQSALVELLAKAGLRDGGGERPGQPAELFGESAAELEPGDA